MFQKIEIIIKYDFNYIFTFCLYQNCKINVKFKKCTALIDRVHRRLSKSYGFCELYTHIVVVLLDFIVYNMYKLCI